MLHVWNRSQCIAENNFDIFVSLLKSFTYPKIQINKSSQFLEMEWKWVEKYTDIDYNGTNMACKSIRLILFKMMLLVTHCEVDVSWKSTTIVLICISPALSNFVTAGTEYVHYCSPRDDSDIRKITLSITTAWIIQCIIKNCC